MVRRFRQECSLTIAVGSAEHRDERTNPFSGAERKAMIEGYLRESGIRDVRVVALEDGPSFSWAIENMIRTCRPQVVYLSTDRNRLATLAAQKVKVVRFQRVGDVSSTRIRNSIARGGDEWTRLTGPSVVRWIRAHDGLARIRAACGRAGTARDRQK